MHGGKECHGKGIVEKRWRTVKTMRKCQIINNKKTRADEINQGGARVLYHSFKRTSKETM